MKTGAGFQVTPYIVLCGVTWDIYSSVWGNLRPQPIDLLFFSETGSQTWLVDADGCSYVAIFVSYNIHDCLYALNKARLCGYTTLNSLFILEIAVKSAQAVHGLQPNIHPYCTCLSESTSTLINVSHLGLVWINLWYLLDDYNIIAYESK